MIDIAGKKKKKAVRIVLKRKEAEKQEAQPKVLRKAAVGGKYNLIATFNPSHSREAENEISNVLSRAGENPKLAATASDGVLKVAVSDARKAVERLRKLCEADPDLFEVTQRYIPIDAWCSSNVKQMQAKVRELAKSLGEKDKWKMSLQDRLWKKMNEKELILKLTEPVNVGEISMESPEKILQVEIIGKETGISLLEPGNILNIHELKE